MKLRNLVLAAAVLAAAASVVSTERIRPGQGAVLPAAVVPHRPLRAQRHALGQRLSRLPEAGQCASGGINGVKLSWEECETGYDTARGVECYERLKGKGAGARSQPLSTGITFALTEKAPADKIPLVTLGYGRSESRRRHGVQVELPARRAPTGPPPTSSCRHIAKKEGGFDKLKGKKIALVYHDSPYGKEPIPLLQERAQDARLRAAAAAGRGARRRAEVHLAADPPARVPTTCCCGAGA